MTDRKLFSPLQAAGATFFGGPLAGAGVMALNERALGSARRAWVIVALGVVATVALVAVGFAIPKVPPIVLPIASMFAVRAIAQQRYGRTYEQYLARGGKPGSVWAVVGVSVGALVLIAGSVFAYVIVTFPSYPSVTVGSVDVLYGDGATEAEARSVGAAVTGAIFTAGQEASVVLTKPHGRNHLGFVMNEKAFHDPAIRAELAGLEGTLSTLAFHGEPVDLAILDDATEVQVEIPWTGAP